MAGASVKSSDQHVVTQTLFLSVISSGYGTRASRWGLGTPSDTILRAQAPARLREGRGTQEAATGDGNHPPAGGDSPQEGCRL